MGWYCCCCYFECMATLPFERYMQNWPVLWLLLYIKSYNWYWLLSRLLSRLPLFLFWVAGLQGHNTLEKSSASHKKSHSQSFKLIAKYYFWQTHNLKVKRLANLGHPDRNVNYGDAAEGIIIIFRVFKHEFPF